MELRGYGGGLLVYSLMSFCVRLNAALKRHKASRKSSSEILGITAKMLTHKCFSTLINLIEIYCLRSYGGSYQSKTLQGFALSLSRVDSGALLFIVAFKLE